MSPIYAVNGLTALFGLSWILAAVWSGRTARRPAAGSQVLYKAMVGIGFLLMFTPHPLDAGGRLPAPAQWLFVAVALAGYAFCWWARLHLGAMWSASVTRKADHHIVDTGPYGLVRHPIYTGLILAAVGVVGVRGGVLTLVGGVLWSAAYWIKARLEERFLRAELGPEAYDAYAARVPMLIPFAPRISPPSGRGDKR